jgi:hypothetical protein
MNGPPNLPAPETWEQAREYCGLDPYWNHVFNTAVRVIAAGADKPLAIKILTENTDPILFMHDVFQIVELFRRRFGVDVRLTTPRLPN